LFSMFPCNGEARPILYHEVATVTFAVTTTIFVWTAALQRLRLRSPGHQHPVLSLWPQTIDLNQGSPGVYGVATVPQPHSPFT
jgi:hypothetical protein